MLASTYQWLAQILIALLNCGSSYWIFFHINGEKNPNDHVYEYFKDCNSNMQDNCNLNIDHVMHRHKNYFIFFC